MKRQFHHCNAWIDTVDFQGDKAEIFYSYETPICASKKYITFDSQTTIDLWLAQNALSYSATTTRQIGRYLGELLGLKNKYFPANEIRAFINADNFIWRTCTGFDVFKCGTLNDFWRLYRG